MDLLLRALLLRGLVSQRLFLLALYAVCFSFYFLFSVVFSIPTAESYPSPEFSDRMDRAAMGPSLIGLPLIALACLSWLVGLILSLCAPTPRRPIWSWVLVAAPLVVFAVCWWLYGGVLSGEARPIHSFFYHFFRGSNRNA